MPDRDLTLALGAKLALALQLRSEQDLDFRRRDPRCVPALSTDPAQVVERMAERDWDLLVEVEARSGVTYASFCRTYRVGRFTYSTGAEGDAEDASFSVAIAKAALSALEAERKSLQSGEGA